MYLLLLSFIIASRIIQGQRKNFNLSFYHGEDGKEEAIYFVYINKISSLFFKFAFV
jgi:hypothetical protein